MTTLYCQLSGLPLGTLEVRQVAGHKPYMQNWNLLITRHPVFSMSTHRLLAFSRSEWNRLAKASIDEVASDAENETLRICFLAVLHSLGSIKQDFPSLPPLHVAQSNMKALFSLAYWKFYLESKRFKFPSYRITRENADFAGIKDYFQVCFDIKTAYETETQELEDEEKKIAAAKAVKKLRDSWIAPISNKELWKWVRAHLPAKYEADAQGWMATIFLGNEKKILQFDKEDITLLIDLILSECPMGTGMLRAVELRLQEIQKIWEDNKEAFTIDFDDFDLDTPMQEARAISTAPTSQEAPKEKDFPTKVAFIKANALWYLQQRASQQQKPASAVTKL